MQQVTTDDGCFLVDTSRREHFFIHWSPAVAILFKGLATAVGHFLMWRFQEFLFLTSCLVVCNSVLSAAWCRPSTTFWVYRDVFRLPSTVQLMQVAQHFHTSHAKVAYCNNNANNFT